MDNHDALMAQAYIRAAREGTFRLPCRSPAEAYKMRFRFYAFLKKVRRGTVALEPAHAEEVLACASKVMIVIEGSEMIMKDKSELPEMAALEELLGEEASSRVVVERESVEAMGERLLASIATPLKEPSAGKYLEQLKRIGQEGGGNGNEG